MCPFSSPCTLSRGFHAEIHIGWQFWITSSDDFFLSAKVKPQIHMSTGVGYKFSGQMSSWPPAAGKRQKPFLVNTVNSRGWMLCNAPFCTAVVCSFVKTQIKLLPGGVPSSQASCMCLLTYTNRGKCHSRGNLECLPTLLSIQICVFSHGSWEVSRYT